KCDDAVGVVQRYAVPQRPVRGAREHPGIGELQDPQAFREVCNVGSPRHGHTSDVELERREERIMALSRGRDEYLVDRAREFDDRLPDSWDSGFGIPWPRLASPAHCGSAG